LRNSIADAVLKEIEEAEDMLAMVLKKAIKDTDFTGTDPQASASLSSTPTPLPIYLIFGST